MISFQLDIMKHPQAFKAKFLITPRHYLTPVLIGIRFHVVMPLEATSLNPILFLKNLCGSCAGNLVICVARGRAKSWGSSRHLPRGDYSDSFEVSVLNAGKVTGDSATKLEVQVGRGGDSPCVSISCQASSVSRSSIGQVNS